jgi:BirA family biotin operon repressor/biotin-[acetyl-CoA-carboxylase] ligase
MKILHLATTPSTMAEARALLAIGDTAIQAVLADTQTAGRGRLGRVWHTFGAPYSMACTYLVRQPCAHLPLVASLAVLEGVGGEGFTIKWPNDILKNGQKVAGILCEGLAPDCFLVGVGLNIQAPAVLPEGFPGAFLGSSQSPESFAKTIGACLFRNLALYSTQGWAAFHNNYAHACSTFGQHITWRGGTGTDELTGLARGLTQQGHLELVANDGTVHIIPSGEIVAQGGPVPPPTAP